MGNLKRDARRAMRDVERAVRIAAKPAVNDGLAILRAGVERRVPLGETGELRRSVRVRHAGAGADWVGGQVVVEAEYAMHVEFGTSEMPPQPFLRPTADNDGDRAATGVGRGLGRRL